MGVRNFMVDFFDEKILIEPLLGVLCGEDVTFCAVGFIGGPVVALKAFRGVTHLHLSPPKTSPLVIYLSAPTPLPTPLHPRILANKKFYCFDNFQW